MKKIYSALIALTIAFTTNAQTLYKVDSTFGADGIVTTSTTNNYLAYASGGVLNNDGTVWLAGQIRGTGNSSASHFIARRLANGNPDVGFGASGDYAWTYTSWTTMGELIDIFAMKNTSAYAPHTGYGGHYAPSATASQTYEEVWQPMNPNITIASHKLNDSLVVSLTATALGVTKGNGTNGFGGYNWFNGVYEGFLPTALNGFTITNNQKVVVQSNEKILVAGMYMNGTTPALFIERLKKNSYDVLDSTFGVNGVSIETSNALSTLNATTFTNLYVQNDNKIIVVVGQSILRLNANGTVDNTFGTNGSFPTGHTIKKVVTNSSNTEIYFTATLGSDNDYIAAYYADGQPIYSFLKGANILLKGSTEINYSALNLIDISINSSNDILVCGGGLKTPTSTPEVFALKLKKGVCPTINISTLAINDTTYKVTITGTTALPFSIYYLPESAGEVVNTGNTVNIDVEAGQSYTVTIVDANGCKGAVQLNTIPAFVNSLETSSTQKVFPNPAHSSISFSLENINQNTTASVYSIIGELIFKENIKHNNSSLNIEHLESGIYILQIKNGDKVTTTKFIKD